MDELTAHQERFEAWARTDSILKGSDFKKRPDGRYFWSTLNMAWSIYQAAIAQPAQDWANGPLSRPDAGSTRHHLLEVAWPSNLAPAHEIIDGLSLVQTRLRKLGYDSYATTCEAAIDAIRVHRDAAPQPAQDETITAQHEETGRMWTGPREALPHRYAEVAQPVAWRAMDSAPKDGTEVILRNASLVRVLAHYMGGGHCIEDHPPIDAGWYYWRGGMFDVFRDPVCWMPAPYRTTAERCAAPQPAPQPAPAAQAERSTTTDSATNCATEEAGARPVESARGAPSITRLRERVAHLERVQEAADAMASDARHFCVMDRRVAAYDAIRKGEK